MKNALTLISAGLILSAAALAQNPPKVEEKKEVIIEKKEGGKQEKKEIIIEKKEGARQEKMEIVIEDGKVTINGKPASEYKGSHNIVIDEDIVIRGNGRAFAPGRGNAERRMMTRPLLGVTTGKDEKGARIMSVTPGSGAEKAGLKEGDIITAINGAGIDNPEQLTEAIVKQKPGDEIDVAFVRDGKNKKVKATLGKSNETAGWDTEEWKFNFEDGKPYAFTLPKLPEMPRMYLEREGRTWVMGGPSPRYGMNIQDDEDGRGVKVTEVEDESNAQKGGLREGDIITGVNGATVKTVDDLREKLNAQKEQLTVSIQVLRENKTETLTIRVPRKLKSASL